MTDVTLVDRSDWGARPAKSVTHVATPHRKVWLHHSAGPQAGPAGVRSIQRYHQDAKQWADIGYSFVYDRPSRTWFEGRGFGVQGAHTEGHNQDLGLCVLGNYNREVPDRTLLEDVAGFLVWAADGGHVSAARIDGGHRDVGSTSCPGGLLYDRIGQINGLAEEFEMGFTDEDRQMLSRVHAELTKEDVAGTVARFVSTTGAAASRFEQTHGPGGENLAAGGGVDLDLLAEKVADVLAARLGN